MKKLLTLIAVGALTLSLVACGGKSQSSSSSGSQTTGNTATSTSYFGKISSVAGNEIEIDLAKEPEMPEQPESAPEQEEGTVYATEMTPATPADAPAGDGAANRTEVEYTGELKSFVIPAGLPIKDAMGNEKQLSDIKKGSIMNVFVDENGSVTEVFLYE